MCAKWGYGKKKPSKNKGETLTNLILDILQHAWDFVEKRQRLVHPLFNHTQVGQHLRTKSQRSWRLELWSFYPLKQICVSQKTRPSCRNKSIHIWTLLEFFASVIRFHLWKWSQTQSVINHKVNRSHVSQSPTSWLKNEDTCSAFKCLTKTSTSLWKTPLNIHSTSQHHSKNNKTVVTK